MTSYKSLALSVVAVLLLSLPLFGQYSAIYSESGVDVLNGTYSPVSYNCASNNCWNELSSTPTFTQFTASGDGNVQAIATNGRRYYWTVGAGTWTEADDGALNGLLKAIYIGGGSGFSLALTTEASGNVYYWNGSAWAHLGSTAVCVDGAADSIGNLYCIGTTGDVYWWNNAAWVDIRTAGDAATIAASQFSVAIVNTSAHLYAADSGGSTTWGEVTSPGVSFSTTIGSLGIADDATISVLGPSGGLNVSHDQGGTWTTVARGGVAVQSIAHTSAANSFMLSTAGKIYHLNAITTQTSYTVTGSCGSACSSGEQVNVAFSTWYNSAQYSAPSGWTCTQGENCSYQTAATTDLNASPVAVNADCDSFVSNGSDNCAPYVHTAIVITIVSVGTQLLNDAQECDCDDDQQKEFNQKYSVTSNNRNSPPTTVGWWGLLSSIFGNYEWKNTVMAQWCTSEYAPDLSGKTVSIWYDRASSAPTAMPGQYVNGDVQGWGNPTKGFKPVKDLVGGYIFQVYAKKGAAGHIYTWDNNSDERGPGGSPVTPCNSLN